VTTMQERLSMRDVVPRGYMARVKLTGFLRSDASTRMTTYKVGREVGAWTTDEIREDEGKPALTPAQRAQVDKERTSSVGPPSTQEPEMADDRAGAQFAEDEPVVVTFDDEEAYEAFSVDFEKRTISGLLVPWGKVAWSGFNKWKFQENSLRWSTAARVKLNLHHDRSRIIAYGKRFASTSRGLEGSFGVGSDIESMQALTKAKDRLLDGFSIEVDFDENFGDDWQPDPSDETIRLVRQAALLGAALTGNPAFDDARVAAVAASRNQEHVDDNQGHVRASGSSAQGAARRVRVAFRAKRQPE
jgi:phage head maturation protease